MTVPKAAQFPQHASPRTWLITSAACPIGIALSRVVLSHGDSIVLGIDPSDASKNIDHGQDRAEEFAAFVRDEVGPNGWRERCRIVGLDGRNVGQCQAAVAEAIQTFGKIDILLCCTSEAIIGTVEELSTSPRTLNLVRSQFETNFFGPVNIIKATLPTLREARSGHIIVLTGITSHLGTPGLGLYCASGWAIEGFCDSLAYEIAPFNVKMTILQPNLEINVLTNKIIAAPSLPQYKTEVHPAPLARTIIGRLLDRIMNAAPASGHAQSSAVSPSIAKRENSDDEASVHFDSNIQAQNPVFLSSASQIQPLYPPLPTAMKCSLIAETVHALTAIAGHENPPARHIVGYEGVASVKEKLKTVSEELEDFVECSAGVDIENTGDTAGNVMGYIPTAE